MYVKQTKFGILVHVAVKMGNIQQVLWMTHKVTCHEVIDVEAKSKDKAKTIRPNFNIKKTTCKAQNILLEFSLITIALLIAISIYCYLIKNQAKNHLLPF